MRYSATLLLVFVLVAGCRDDVAVLAPEPVAMTDDAVSHYCMMSLEEHPGPKAQIHLDGVPDPIFFAQVRDGIAYLKQPERSAGIIAIYVSNMSRAPSWGAPGIDNWIAAEDAIFVVGADVTGGMGAPELAPFETEDAARDFAALHGGEVMRLDQIPAEAVLGAVEIIVPAGG
jgi:copper chaperone NosL